MRKKPKPRKTQQPKVKSFRKRLAQTAAQPFLKRIERGSSK